MKQELNQHIHGIVPPVPTPLTESGAIDVPALERLLERVIQGGVHGVFMLGTTGEGLSLGDSRRYELLAESCRIVDDRIPIFVGITATAYTESIQVARRAADSGCEAVVAAPPPYFPLSEEEMEAYFLRLAKDSPLPLVLYNFPGVTGMEITAETVGRLLDEQAIVGLKDSSGDLDYFQRVLGVTASRKDFPLLIGPEALLPETLAMGGSGGVTGGANIWPELFVDLYNSALEGDQQHLAALVDNLNSLGRFYDVGPRTPPAIVARIKCALSICGVCSDATALPISRTPPTERQKIEQILRELPIPAELFV